MYILSYSLRHYRAVSVGIASAFQVSEIEVKAAQLLKLTESLEEYMMNETMKKLTKDLNLAFAERGREEGALPTDLWKRPVRLKF